MTESWYAICRRCYKIGFCNTIVSTENGWISNQRLYSWFSAHTPIFRFPHASRPTFQGHISGEDVDNKQIMKWGLLCPHFMYKFMRCYKVTCPTVYSIVGTTVSRRRIITAGWVVSSGVRKLLPKIGMDRFDDDICRIFMKTVFYGVRNCPSSKVHAPYRANCREIRK